ncbi:MAG TPA: VLRF1 family aeRF1-type release factor [bacterium]|nr:VLRF1 family aeRF1-type release factor [bacterium]
MLDTQRLNEIVKLDRDDVFSLSLNTDPSLVEHQRPKPAYRVWTHNAVQRLVRRLAPDVRRTAEPAAQRILAHLDAMPQEGRGLAIFAGPDLWQDYTLPFPLPNHLTYGAPDTIPLLWAMHEYAPYAVVLAFHDHARVLVAYLGQTTAIDEIDLELDTEKWRFKTGRMATSTRRSGVGVGRGIQSSAFEARVLAQYHRFWRNVAVAAARTLAARGIDRVIIGGDQEAAGAVSAALPRPLRETVIGTVAIRPHASLAEIQARTLPLALADRHARDRRLVRSVVQERRVGGTAIDGTAATLEALADGNLRTVVANRDMRATARACVSCGALGVKPGPCAACSGDVRRLTLPQALPMLTRQHGAALELVSADAAAPLADGIGGLLRHPSAGSVNLRRGA